MSFQKIGGEYGGYLHPYALKSLLFSAIKAKNMLESRWQELTSLNVTDRKPFTNSGLDMEGNYMQLRVRWRVGFIFVFTEE